MQGLEGVHLDVDLTAAVASALNAPRPDAAKARRLHGWGERVGRIFEALDLPLPAAGGSEVLVRQRPPVRYRRSERV